MRAHALHEVPELGRHLDDGGVFLCQLCPVLVDHLDSIQHCLKLSVPAEKLSQHVRAMLLHSLWAHLPCSCENIQLCDKDPVTQLPPRMVVPGEHFVELLASEHVQMLMNHQRCISEICVMQLPALLKQGSDYETLQAKEFIVTEGLDFLRKVELAWRPHSDTLLCNLLPARKKLRNRRCLPHDHLLHTSIHRRVRVGAEEQCQPMMISCVCPTIVLAICT
mmetsp:Transcript_43514/g.78143  ORF Transcript_43514/g.78143 Transcript_43514/m.78143 type:complete len:221 (+) Transcript_43514:1683-2345(+)